MAGASGQLSIRAGERPLERSAIALYAEGVRSMRRLLAQADPQQLRSPQKELVSGPQSAIDTLTHEPLHWLVT
jgi:hypothetical protein